MENDDTPLKKDENRHTLAREQSKGYDLLDYGERINLLRGSRFYLITNC